MRDTQVVEALRGRAQMRGQDPALRRKRRGKWTTLTWGELRQEVAQLAGAPSDALFEPETVPRGAPREADEMLLLLAASHGFVMGGARPHPPLGEALWLGHSGAAGKARDVVCAWLKEGFVLSLPEREGDPWTDAREIEPTVLLGDAATYSSLAEGVWARLPSSGSWERRLVDRALARTEGPLSWLVIRSLRCVLGLRRARVAYAIGGDGWPDEAGSLFRALGISTEPFVADGLLAVTGDRFTVRPEAIAQGVP